MTKIDKATADALLARFNDTPTEAQFMSGNLPKGLDDAELVQLIQYLTDTGEVYTYDYQYWGETFAADGKITGFDPSKMVS